MVDVVLIIAAVLAAALGLGWWVWRLSSRAQAPQAGGAEGSEPDQELAARFHECEHNLTVAETTLAARSDQLAASGREREALGMQLQEHRRALAAARADLAEAAAERSERTEQRDVFAAERDEARKRLEQSEERLKAATKELAETKTELNERTEQRDTVWAERDQARERLEHSEQRLSSAAAELAKAKSGLSERSELLESVTAERDQARARLGIAEESLANTTAELAEVKADHEARREEIAKQRESLDTQFKGIASEVIKSTSEEFRKQAQADFKSQRELSTQDLEARQQAVDNLVKPVGETLERLQKRVGEIEEKREGAYSKVEELVGEAKLQLGQLRDTGEGLRRALSSPQQRGRWGELTLERVIESANMTEHVDYVRQQQSIGDDGAIRPDAVIRMPRGISVPVDAKTPLDAYLRAHEAEDMDAQRTALAQHAQSLMNHARSLGAKKYAEAIDGQSPNFVVLFVPAETILDAAMRSRPTIWEDAWSQHSVLIASPGLLIALLRTVALSWQQEDIQRNAQEIADTANELHSRLRVYAGHVRDTGRALSRAVTAYNKGVGSFESRVLVQARRIEELGAVAESAQIDDLEPINPKVRELRAPELAELPERIPAEHAEAAG